VLLSMANKPLYTGYISHVYDTEKLKTHCKKTTRNVQKLDIRLHSCYWHIQNTAKKQWRQNKNKLTLKTIQSTWVWAQTLCSYTTDIVLH